MLSFIILLALLVQSKSLLPLAAPVATGQHIRQELVLAANKCRSSVAFIPRSQADLETILLHEASDKLRDGLTVEKSFVKYAKTLYFLPFHDTIGGFSGNLTETFVTPYFKDNYRVVSVGDTFSTRGGQWAPQFKVVSIDGHSHGHGLSYIVGPDTRIARGLVDESSRSSEPPQFQYGSVRPFHVNTVSDIQSDKRADENFNRLYSDGNYRVIPTFKSLDGPYGYPRLPINEDKIDNPEGYVRQEYRSCKCVKDLMIAMRLDADLKFLSYEGGTAPASLVLDGFFNGRKTRDLIENDITLDMCSRIFRALALEVKRYENAVSVNALEVSIGRIMLVQGPATRTHLEQKFGKYSSMYQLLQFLDYPEEILNELPDTISKLPTSLAIEFFTQLHRRSFLERMEEIGMPFLLAASVLYLFGGDVTYIHSPKSPWQSFTDLIKKLVTDVASLFGR